MSVGCAQKEEKTGCARSIKENRPGRLRAWEIKKDGDEYMRPLTSNSMLLMERTIGSLWTRQAAISDNITNAETPGYKAKYVTFEDALRTRLERAMSGGRDGAAVRGAIDRTGATIHVAQSESTRVDENGVNVTDQMVEMDRVVFQQQYAIQAISTDFAVLRAAIKGQ